MKPLKTVFTTIVTTAVLLILSMLFISLPTQEHVYPARVVDKLLISPTEIPYRMAGYADDGEPFYDEEKTLTSYAFIIVRSGSCAIIPVDEAYFDRIEENDFVPVVERRVKYTGSLEYQGIYYDHKPGDKLPPLTKR